MPTILTLLAKGKKKSHINTHNFHIKLLSYPYLPTAHRLIIIKEHIKRTLLAPNLADWGLNYGLWAKSSLLSVYLNKCHWNTATFTYILPVAAFALKQ